MSKRVRQDANSRLPVSLIAKVYEFTDLEDVLGVFVDVCSAWRDAIPQMRQFSLVFDQKTNYFEPIRSHNIAPHKITCNFVLFGLDWSPPFCFHALRHLDLDGDCPMFRIAAILSTCSVLEDLSLTRSLCFIDDQAEQIMFPASLQRLTLVAVRCGLNLSQLENLVCLALTRCQDAKITHALPPGLRLYLKLAQYDQADTHYDLLRQGQQLVALDCVSACFRAPLAIPFSLEELALTNHAKSMALDIKQPLNHLHKLALNVWNCTDLLCQLALCTRGLTKLLIRSHVDVAMSNEPRLYQAFECWPNLKEVEFRNWFPDISALPCDLRCFALESNYSWISTDFLARLRATFQGLQSLTLWFQNEKHFRRNSAIFKTWSVPELRLKGYTAKPHTLVNSKTGNVHPDFLDLFPGVLCK